MTRKIRLIGLSLIALLLFCAPLYAADVKIGIANLQKALNECDAGNRAKETLKEEARKLEETLNAKQEDLKKLKDEIDKKSGVWNKETAEKKEREFREKSQDFQQNFMNYNDMLNKKKQDKEAQIIEELRDIVEELAKKKGYTFVFEKSVGGVLYSPANVDITDDVIKEHNKRFRAK